MRETYTNTYVHTHTIHGTQSGWNSRDKHQMLYAHTHTHTHTIMHNIGRLLPLVRSVRATVCALFYVFFFLFCRYDESMYVLVNIHTHG